MLKILLLLVITVAIGTLPILWAAALISTWTVTYIGLGIWTLGVLTAAVNSKA